MKISVIPAITSHFFDSTRTFIYPFSMSRVADERWSLCPFSFDRVHFVTELTNLHHSL